MIRDFKSIVQNMRNDFFIVLALLMSSAITTSTYGSDASFKAELEYRIEDTIKKLIGPLIEPQQMVIIVKVNELPPKPSSTGIPKNSQLPYSSVKVEPGVLERLLSRSQDDDLLQSSYEIEIAFDESVADETVTLVNKKIKMKLGIDDQKRIFKSAKAKLIKPKAEVAPPTPSNDKPKDNPQAAKENLPQNPASPVPQDPNESVRIENERTKLELERLKFEASKKEAVLNENFRKERLDLEEKIKLNQDKGNVDKDPKAQEGDKAKPTEPEKTMIDHLKDFQLSILSLMALVGLLLLGILLGGSHKKGLSALSTSMQGLGEALKATGNKPAAETASTPSTEQSKDPTSENGNKNQVGVSSQNIIQDERYKQFLVLVEEKIEVLTGEGNFGFYRHFLDMIAKQVQFAAAILVSVKPETARRLVEAISVEDLAKIRDFLAKDGALGEAQANRGKAMEAFYGKISLDEFTDSPLLGIKEASWITKLTTQQLRDLVLSLSGSDQSTFLAVFTPSRLVQIINTTTDESQKNQIIEALKQLDMAKASDLVETLSKAHEIFKTQQAQQLENVKRIIDNPKFYADIVVDLNPDTRERFLKSISERTELLDVIKNYYIPFDDLENVTPRILKDIFGRRPANQTALILLTAKESLHAAVIDAVPEALRDTVKEELEALKSDESNKRKNEQKSASYQEEVARYLLQLNREGLLEYKKDQGQGGATPKLAAAS